MISHFYLHITVGDKDCQVIGSRQLGVPESVTVERIVVDGKHHTERYTRHLLAHHACIYREIERKLGLPLYTVNYPYTRKSHHEHF
jgi:hypothetical protein